MSATSQQRAPSMGQRRFGRFNMLGLWTLSVREVRRFTNIWSQTLGAPVVTAVLFITVFSLAFASQRGEAAVAYTRFIAPGVLMMTVIQNAFANTSSSLLVSKVQGNIVDTLMPPLSAAELTLGYTAGGVVRGMLVAMAVALIVFPAIGLGVAQPLWAIAFVLAASAQMALLGIIGAILADKFDHLAVFTNFVVTPLSFLSGTFYSIAVLPGWLQAASRANPFFYMIDGVRYGVLGQGDASPVLGIGILLAADIGLGLLAWWWFRIGFRLKA